MAEKPLARVVGILRSETALRFTLTPRRPPFTSAMAKFIRLNKAPALIHASAVSSYPVGGWQRYGGMPSSRSDRTSDCALYVRAPVARTALTTNSKGVLTFAS